MYTGEERRRRKRRRKRKRKEGAVGRIGTRVRGGRGERRKKRMRSRRGGPQEGQRRREKGRERKRRRRIRRRRRRKNTSDHASYSIKIKAEEGREGGTEEVHPSLPTTILLLFPLLYTIPPPLPLPPFLWRTGRETRR